MATNPSSPFDFTRASSLADILSPKTNEIFTQFRWQRVPLDRARRSFYEALQAPDVNASIRRQVADILELRLLNLAENLFRSGDIRTEHGEFTAEGLTDMFGKFALTRTDSILDVSESAIHIAKIKGAAANPLMRAIAQEVTALETDDRHSLKSIKDALVKAHEQTTKPPLPKPKPKAGGHFDI